MAFNETPLNDYDVKSVLHVGADRGNELQTYIKMGCEYVCFIEANAELFEELTIMIRRILSNNKYPDIKVDKYLQLIADEDNVEMDFNIYYGPDAKHMLGNKGLSSLLTAQNTWWGSEGHKRTEQLISLTLDTFCTQNNYKAFDLLNIDTQGSELRILNNSIKILENIKFINCEVTFDSYQYENNPLHDDVNNFLCSHNFELLDIKYEDGGRWGDALYKKIGI